MGYSVDLYGFNRNNSLPGVRIYDEIAEIDRMTNLFLNLLALLRVNMMKKLICSKQNTENYVFL